MLPSPRNISYMWNFGSLLGACLTIQLLSGILVRLHYSSHIDEAFSSVSHIIRDVNYGWLIRVCHANGARLFFIFLYLHVARGMYFQSFVFMIPWIAGVSLLLLVIATAFLGYVLPWGQISFWGATVITNLFSAIPSLGEDIVLWLWGGFAVDAATLSRFYSFHFLLPFIVSGLRLVHLALLHEYGSRNPLGLPSRRDKIPFTPYFRYKDLLGVIFTMLVFLAIVIYKPWALGDPENFVPANPLVTPIHIQPEWYFLFAYAILRAIPNKLGGVMALALSVGVLYVIPYMSHCSFKGAPFNGSIKLLVWALFSLVLLLTWIGARPVESPYIELGAFLTTLYFRWFLIYALICKIN